MSKQIWLHPTGLSISTYAGPGGKPMVQLDLPHQDHLQMEPQELTRMLADMSLAVMKACRQPHPYVMANEEIPEFTPAICRCNIAGGDCQLHP